MTDQPLAIIERLIKALIFVPIMGVLAWWLFANWLDRTLSLSEAAAGAGLLAIAFLLGAISIVSGGWGFLGILAVIYIVLLALACWEYAYWRQRERQHWLDEIAKSEEIIQRDPRFAAAYSFLGQAHMKLRNYDEAVAAFEKTLELDP